jgi:hypothetical protein
MDAARENVVCICKCYSSRRVGWCVIGANNLRLMGGDLMKRAHGQLHNLKKKTIIIYVFALQ